MEFKVKKGKELDLDSRIAELQASSTTSRFTWYFDWLKEINTSIFQAHHPNDPSPTKLKQKILGDLMLLQAREQREEFCWNHLDLFYQYERPPITPKKLDDTISALFHNRDYFQELPAEEYTHWEDLSKRAVEAENLLRNALNPELEIQDYALRYLQMNSGLAIYLWTRRELRAGNLEEVRKQYEGTVEKRLEPLKRYAPIAGVAAMIGEAFSGEPMPPPFKKIVPEAPKDASPEEKEEIEQEKAKVLSEKNAIEAKVKSLTEQRQPLDTLFADVALLRLLAGSEVRNAASDFQPDPQSKVGIKNPGNILAILMILGGEEKLDAKNLTSSRLTADLNEAATFILGKIDAEKKMLGEPQVSGIVRQTVDRIVEEAKSQIVTFTGGKAEAALAGKAASI